MRYPSIFIALVLFACESTSSNSSISGGEMNTFGGEMNTSGGEMNTSGGEMNTSGGEMNISELDMMVFELDMTASELDMTAFELDMIASELDATIEVQDAETPMDAEVLVDSTMSFDPICLMVCEVFTEECILNSLWCNDLEQCTLELSDCSMDERQAVTACLSESCATPAGSPPLFISCLMNIACMN
jgi:hypothetical protein